MVMKGRQYTTSMKKGPFILELCPNTLRDLAINNASKMTIGPECELRMQGLDRKGAGQGPEWMGQVSDDLS